MRQLNNADQEVLDKIKELQLFVNKRLVAGHLSDLNKGQLLINDIQTIHYIWRKD